MKQILGITLISALLSSCASFSFSDLFGKKPGTTRTVVSSFPSRPIGAMTGSRFVGYVAKMTNDQREAAILQEITKGNIPNFLRKLQPVRVVHRTGNRVYTGTVWVTPDYLAIGSDSDFIRIP